MEKYTFKPGDRVEIHVGSQETDSAKTYISQIHEIEDSGVLLVYTPIYRGRLVALEMAKYALLFMFDNHLVSFNASASVRIKKEGFNVVRFQLLDEGKRVQRRQFYRFDCVLPMKFSPIYKKPSPTQSSPMIDGVVRDISGGGMRFVSNESLELGDNLKCILILGREYIIVIGNVLRKDYVEGEKPPYKFEYRLIFAGILPDEQEKIVQFIFQEQRRQLKRIPHGSDGDGSNT